MECATVRILNPVSTVSERINADVVSRCDTDATLRMEVPVLVGATVQVRFRNRIGLGEVRACTDSNGHFDITVHFQDVLETGEE